MRMLKINSEIQKLVSKIIDKELNNSNITGIITIQEVTTAADFSNSKIYVSMMGSKNNQKTLEALNKARGYIRTRIAKELNFKQTPKITFVMDELIEKGARIDKLIEQVSEEIKETEKKREEQ